MSRTDDRGHASQAVAYRTGSAGVCARCPLQVEPVKRIAFERPPINEVVVGCTFQPLQRLLVPHFGSLWDLVRSEYPLCQHGVPVADDDGGVVLDLESKAPLPRVWLLSEDRVRLLQLQLDRFYSNWRQSDKVDAPYSRFESVYGPYQQYFQTLSTFMCTQLGEQIQQRRLVVTYVNLLKQGREWQTQADLPRVFRDLRVPVSQKWGAIGSWAFKSAHALADGPGTITVSINPAVNKVSGEQALRIELTAGCEVSALAGMIQGDWFELAHQAIVQGFCDLTSEEAQQHWGRLA